MITRVELQQYRRMTDHHRRSPEAKAFRRKLEEALAALPEEYRKLVVLRYCCRLGWEAVAMRMHYSRRQIFRIDEKICKLLAESSDTHQYQGKSYDTICLEEATRFRRL